MYGIDLLVEEHDNIIRFIKVVKKMCIVTIEGKAPDPADFVFVVAFGRNYADSIHHGKEEEILFDIMLKNLGPLADKLIRNGMLVEHDLGRLFMKQLDEAIKNYTNTKSAESKLAIITNASGYGDLLMRHIEKENAAAYPFAAKNLSEELCNQLNDETSKFEEREDTIKRKQYYLDILQRLQNKYQ